MMAERSSNPRWCRRPVLCIPWRPDRFPAGHPSFAERQFWLGATQATRGLAGKVLRASTTRREREPLPIGPAGRREMAVYSRVAQTAAERLVMAAKRFPRHHQFNIDREMFKVASYTV